MAARGGDELGRIRSAVAHARTPLPPDAVGPGDDAAVLPWQDEDLVASTDVVSEDVHFLRAADPRQVGAFAATVSLSDLAAMGAAPRGLLVATSFPASVDADWADGVAAGVARCLDAYACPLLGGDTKEARSGAPATITTTALGTVPRGTALRRDGGRVGDVLLVTGPLGGPAAALHLHAEGRMSATECMTQVLGVAPHLEAGCIAREGGAHAAVDLSDGLARAAALLAGPGRTVALEAPDVPLHPLVAEAMAGPWWGDVSGRQVVLGTGGEYVLLVACPPERVARLVERLQAAGRDAVPVGRLVAASEGGPGARLRTPEGEHDLDALGWRHFGKD